MQAILWTIFWTASAAAAVADARIASDAGADGSTRLVFASCKDGDASEHSWAGNSLSFNWSLVAKRQPHAFVRVCTPSARTDLTAAEGFEKGGVFFVGEIVGGNVVGPQGDGVA